MAGTSVKRPAMFAALQVAPFRRFALGQAVSLVGSWTETVAQALLVLHLTDSGLILGLATAARYFPVLVLGPFAGVLVDRFNKHRVLLVTQTVLAALSVVLGVMVLTGTVTIGAVFVIAFGFGAATAVDNPARQAFIPELVGEQLLRNAVTLNSTFVNVGRAVGPVVSAVLIGSIGIGWCFIVNAVSFAAVLAALLSIRPSMIRTVTRPPRKRGQLREGLRVAAGTPEILGPLLMMVLIGTFTYEFEVSLPLLARTSINAGADTYSWLIGAFGVGSVLGGLYCTRRPQTGLPRLLRASVLYAAALVVAGLAPSAWVAVLALVAVGMASITFLTTGNSTVQLAAGPQMRGRITALWSTAFIGSTPIGATIIGAIGAADARVAVLVGAAACVAAFAVGAAVSRAKGRPQPGISDSPTVAGKSD